ncbi:hypothetical protein BRC86_13490 [Halobacteriales archaeon QS_3_64_16]|nr:MAG: hypothetical protein BRC86_13490 [Halobacteriales archaeon QS_3_64_16]
MLRRYENEWARLGNRIEPVRSRPEPRTSAGLPTDSTAANSSQEAQSRLEDDSSVRSRDTNQRPGIRTTIGLPVGVRRARASDDETESWDHGGYGIEWPYR